MRKYTEEEKQSVIARYAVSKETVSDILDDTGVTRSSFYRWPDTEREDTAHHDQ